MMKIDARRALPLHTLVGVQRATSGQVQPCLGADPLAASTVRIVISKKIFLVVCCQGKMMPRTGRPNDVRELVPQ